MQLGCFTSLCMDPELVTSLLLAVIWGRLPHVAIQTYVPWHLPHTVEYEVITAKC